MSAQLELEDVSRRFRDGGAPAVVGLSLEVERGEIVALVGPSGCGKTTTLRLVAGFDRPSTGVIRIAGVVVASAAGVFVPSERRQVGVVFQDFALFPHLTVGANVAFGLDALAREARRARVHEMLTLVGLEDRADRYPHQLSGGQQQRVAVARALAPAPALLLLDEPFSNLDADLREHVRGVVQRAIRATGSTALFVTHDQEEAFELADRVGIMSRGNIEQLGTPDDVYHRPATRFVATLLGPAEFVPGRAAAEGIQTELGLFARPADVPPGTAVDLLVRPDDVGFVETAAGDARLVSRVFRGSEARYVVELPSGLRLASSQASSTVTPVGARVRVSLDLDHIVAFPRDGARGASVDRRR